MERYNRLFVPLDGSVRSAAVLNAVGAVSRAMSLPVTAAGIVGTTLTVSLVDTLHRQLEGAGIEDAEVLVAKPDVGIVEDLLSLVRQRPGALVCLASTARPHTGATLGSVAEGLITGLHQPVLLVGPGIEPDTLVKGGRAVVAVDGTTESEIILAEVPAWARAFPLVPEVVQVTDPSALTGSASQPIVDPGAESGYVARLAAGIQTELGRRVDYEVLHHKNPGEALLDRANDAALVMMTTHAATGWHRLVEGSVAMTVLHRARCPVLLEHRH